MEAYDLSTRSFLLLTVGRASSFGLSTLHAPLACTRGGRREIWEESGGAFCRSCTATASDGGFKPPVATGDSGTEAPGTLTYISAHPEQNAV